MTGLLIRHSATLWNEWELWQGGNVDPPLSDRGRQAACRLREVIPQFAKRATTRRFSSPMLRSVETVRLALGTDDITLLPDLVEIGSGEIAGRPFAEIRETHADFLEAWFAGDLRTPPGGEDIADFNKRVGRSVSFLEGVEEDWVAVAHMGVLHSAVAQLGLSPERVPNLSGLLYSKEEWSHWSAPDLPALPLRVAVGSDHHGRGMEDLVASHLTGHGLVVDRVGPRIGQTDYPPVAIEVAEAVRLGNYDRGVLICGTGIGMSIAANAVEGVRAAAVSDRYSAERASASNDCQILTLGSAVVDDSAVPEMLDAWISNRLDSARSLRKVSQIVDYERRDRQGLQ